MTSTVSFAEANAPIINAAQANMATQNVPSSSTRASTQTEDTVQLSSEAQQYLTSTKPAAPKPQPSFTQVIKEAADGDIAAIAQLALIA